MDAHSQAYAARSATDLDLPSRTDHSPNSRTFEVIRSKQRWASCA